MINACRHVRIESWIKIGKHECLLAELVSHRSSLSTLIFSHRYLIFFIPDPPQLTAVGFLVAEISPALHNSFLHVIIVAVLQKALPMSFNLQELVFSDDKLFKFLLQELVDVSKTRMQGRRKIRAASHFVSNTQVAIANDRATHLVCHFSRTFIANPGMDTSAA